MKKLEYQKNNRRIQSLQDIWSFELTHNIEFRDVLKEFLLKYEGVRLADSNKYYYSCGHILQELNQVVYLNKSDQGGASIESILEVHKEEGILDFIPFGTDSGGWDYNISINKETYGQVWVNKFDIGDTDSMEYVTSSFEEFIDNLGPEV
ncbi:MAG: SMI1/KNR4 family protein [Cyclobacteriaceae bacterium]